MEKSNMSEKTLVRDLTQGSIVKSLLSYAAPLFIANALQAVYNVVDMMVVGQVEGGLGMAAVSIGGDIIHIVTFLLIGFTGAGQIILSQFVGAKKSEEIKKMIGTMFVVTFTLSLMMFILCMLLGESFMELINADFQVRGPAKAYYVTGICGVFFIAGYNCICSILRGMGDSKHPLYFIGIASILNIILDIVFVAVFRWSTFGASLATVIGQTVSFIIGLVFLYRHKAEFGFDFKRRSFRVHREVFIPLVKLGIPMSIQMAAITLSKTVLAAWINDCGWVYTALAGVYNKLSMFIGIITNSLTTAGGANIAQNIGAAKYHRVPKILFFVFLTTGVLCGICTLAVVLFPTQIFSMFTTDAQVISVSGVLVTPLALFFIGGIARSVGFSLINGSGNSKMNLLVALLDGIIFRIGLAYLFGFVMEMSVRGFWLGDALAGFMPFVIAAAFFASGRWKKNSHIIKAED